MNEKVFKIFIDFDGTITEKDTGDSIFSHFGDTEKVEEIVTRLLSDAITARQCWIELCGTVDRIYRHELDEFLKTINVDPHFHKFADYCRENNIDFYVLSDGFDYYIDRIFAREDLRDIKYYANHLDITDEGILIPSFPYEDQGCTTSANCKRNHIITHSSDDDFTIYIGDGNSDKYTSQFCDFIFAKDDLLKFCEKERISFFPYKNFSDVTMRLEQLLKRKRLKKRHQADLKRREIYMIE
jgi:2-hydroxy-3-keto-5-methylthiopentenyl-1-phosphate phosphatase